MGAANEAALATRPAHFLFFRPWPPGLAGAHDSSSAFDALIEPLKRSPAGPAPRADVITD